MVFEKSVGRVHGREEEEEEEDGRGRIIIIIIRNGAKTISRQTSFGRLNNRKRNFTQIWCVSRSEKRFKHVF